MEKLEQSEQKQPITPGEHLRLEEREWAGVLTPEEAERLAEARAEVETVKAEVVEQYKERTEAVRRYFETQLKQARRYTESPRARACTESEGGNPPPPRPHLVKSYTIKSWSTGQ